MVNASLSNFVIFTSAPDAKPGHIFSNRSEQCLGYGSDLSIRDEQGFVNPSRAVQSEQVGGWPGFANPSRARRESRRFESCPPQHSKTICKIVLHGPDLPIRAGKVGHPETICKIVLHRREVKARICQSEPSNAWIMARICQSEPSSAWIMARICQSEPSSASRGEQCLGYGSDLSIRAEQCKPSRAVQSEPSSAIRAVQSEASNAWVMARICQSEPSSASRAEQCKPRRAVFGLWLGFVNPSRAVQSEPSRARRDQGGMFLSISPGTPWNIATRWGTVCNRDTFTRTSIKFIRVVRGRI